MTNAGVWVNSWYGTVLRASVRFVDCEMPRIEEEHDLKRIREWLFKRSFGEVRQKVKTDRV